MLKDKVVLITGAGSGLGRALASAFCTEGATVIGLGRTLKSLEETHAHIKTNSQAEGSNKFFFYQTDTSDFSQLQKTINAIVASHNRIDYLFNNAAVYPRVNFIDETANEFSQALNINVSGVANTCKAVLPVMIKQQFGRIYNVGSFADLAPIANSAVYSASKGAVRALTKAIAADVAHYNLDIQVHEWIPGHVNTQMSDYTGMDPATPAAWAVALTQRVGSKANCIFSEDSEWLPPKSLKQKIKAKLFFWKNSDD